MHQRHVARLALDRIREDVSRVAQFAGAFGSGLERNLWRRDDARQPVGESRIVGFRRFAMPGAQVLEDRRRGGMLYFSSTASASAQVVASGSVGPEAITDGSSPGTSEMSRVSMRAGRQASARRPPLIAERCFRTQLISPIVAPEFSSSRDSARLSSSVMPSPGSASGAEPPPEIRQRTRSSAVRPATVSVSRRRAASRPAASGTGCAASTISMCLQGTACP